MGQGKGVVASFWSESKNLGGWSLLPVVVGEFKDLYLPSGWSLLPIGAIEIGIWCFL